MTLLELNTDYRKNFWDSYTMTSKFFHPWFWFMSWSSDKCLFIFLKTRVFLSSFSGHWYIWKWFFFFLLTFIHWKQFCHKISVSHLFFSLEILLMVFYYVWVLLLFRRRNVERAWVLQLWDFSSFWICMNFSLIL